MIGRIVTVFIQDVKAYFKNHMFWITNITLVLLLTFLLLVLLPYNNFRNFTRPLLGTVYSHIFIIMLVFINIALKDGKINFDNITSIQEWLNNKYSLNEIIVAKVFSLTLINSMLLLSTVPISLLVSYAGGFSLKSLFLLYPLTFVTTVAFGCISMYSQQMYSENVNKVTNTLFVIYLLGLALTYVKAGNEIHLHINFHAGIVVISLLLLLDLVIDLRGVIFNR